MAHLIFQRVGAVSVNGYSIPSICLRRLNPSRCNYSKMPPLTHKCSIDAEPLYRHEPGGYHPLELGETLKDGRYKVLHKLGWGGYSTTWAAKDQGTNSYVAVKVKVSEVKENRELKVLQALSALPRNHPGSSRITQLLDHFTLEGPNGSHECLVLEIAGPNIADSVGPYCYGSRLPAELLKVVTKQVLQGLDFLTLNDIAHGDLHTRNIALAVPDLNSLSEEDFVARLGKVETGAVTRLDGGPLEDNLPTRIVEPASFQKTDVMLSCPSVKILDFGEAFFGNNAPDTLHTPVALRAPEVVFGDRLDPRVDLWSAGCMIFELITGQPPFDTIGQTTPLLVE
ncbi:cmgc srpk kinase [Fusarium sporotrichioides]|uniref:non-specific serine/threonine protein kinase n=1 Tax=Fusarium sporotrichioides TaxID=5514 RepID=A0A395SBY3_FUSSP|nr:cmgc srpk kinase [Fusarium sporotrichioides]